MSAYSEPTVTGDSPDQVEARRARKLYSLTAAVRLSVDALQDAEDLLTAAIPHATKIRDLLIPGLRRIRSAQAAVGAACGVAPSPRSVATIDRFVSYEISPVYRNENGTADPRETFEQAQADVEAGGGEAFWSLYGKSAQGEEFCIYDCALFSAVTKTYSLITGHPAPATEARHLLLPGAL